jgi:cation:H+ antiporter
MLMQVGLLLLSIIGLYFGAEIALESAERIGRKWGLPSLVIGLVIIGFGTSLPELFVSQLACLNGESEIALGNIIGSNVANSFLILGISALITPLALANKGMRVQLIFHFFLHVFVGLILYFFGINQWSGIVLLGMFIFYLYYTLTHIGDDESKEEKELPEVRKRHYFFLIFGFAMLYFSGELLVGSGSELGRLAGISTYVISAIFVAFGTSFPELVTAVLACKKKKDTDIIIGNIIGSNVFNLALVMGSISFYPLKNSKFFIESIALILFSTLVLFLFKLNARLTKVLGSIFLLVYGGIVSYWIFQ